MNPILSRIQGINQTLELLAVNTICWEYLPVDQYGISFSYWIFIFFSFFFNSYFIQSEVNVRAYLALKSSDFRKSRWPEAIAFAESCTWWRCSPSPTLSPSAQSVRHNWFENIHQVSWTPSAQTIRHRLKLVLPAARSQAVMSRLFGSDLTEGTPPNRPNNAPWDTVSYVTTCRLWVSLCLWKTFSRHCLEGKVYGIILCEGIDRANQKEGVWVCCWVRCYVGRPLTEVVQCQVML